MPSTDEMEKRFINRTDNDLLTYCCHQLLYCSNFFSDEIFKYFDMENTYRHFDVGKFLSTQLAKKARCKNTNHSCGALQGVR